MGGRDRVNRITTEKDLDFLEALLHNGGNSLQAALSAGFPESVAHSHASQWVKPAREDSLKPDLWDLYNEYRNKRLSHLDVTEDRILTELARIAYFDPINMFDENGKLLHIKDMPEDTRRVIGGVEVMDTTFLEKIIKIKLAQKDGALAQLARIRGMNTDRIVNVHTFADLLDKVTDSASQEPLVTESDNNADTDE